MKEYLIIKSSPPPHLDEDRANKVIEHLEYTQDNTLYTKPFWSLEEIQQATSGLEFPEGTTKYDIWVALNFFYADTCKVLNARQALEAGYQFYFNDEDAPDNKLGRYLQAMGLL